MIELQNVKKKFKKKQVLHGINMTIGQGIYGLLGPNGAGKTTLLRCITGIYTDYSGKILYDKRELNSPFGRKIGYLPQKFDMFHELTLAEMMTYFAELKKIPKERRETDVRQALELVNLESNISDRIGSFSGGMIRRAGIAQAILGNPQVIIVDEPTAGLDPEERLRFKGVVSRISRDRTVILSTHIIEDVEALCDQIIMMSNGKIPYQGRIEEVSGIAKGHVFIGEAGTLIPDGAVLIKQFEREGNLLMRILSSQPLPSWEEDMATVEDGYMYVIKGLCNETVSAGF